MTASSAIRTPDDIRAQLERLPGFDPDARASAVVREQQLTKPAGALGRLEELAEWLAMWQGRHPPRVERAAAHVFAANHGVAARGVSAFPAAVTAQMVANFEAGGAAINQLCRTFGVELRVTAISLDRPTGDFTQVPAMDEAGFMEAFRIGMDAVDDGFDVICLGEMGIGNTTAAATVAHALYGGAPGQWVGPGTGVEGEARLKKVKAVGDAVARHGPAIQDGIDALRLVGGRELAAMAGATLAARLQKVPVVLDGYVSTAAAAALQKTAANALHHCQVGHLSAEPAHARLCDILGKRPILNLGMRLGEGTGAVLATQILRGAANCHAGMATFAQAGVSGKS